MVVSFHLDIGNGWFYSWLEILANIINFIVGFLAGFNALPDDGWLGSFLNRFSFVRKPLYVRDILRTNGKSNNKIEAIQKP